MTAVMEAPVEVAAERLRELDEQIAAKKAARAELDFRFREQKASLADGIRDLEDERRAFLRQRAGARERGPLDAHKQAGKRNVSAMADAARRKRVASQAELAVASGVGTGSTTWAIRALVEDGVLVDTGERRDGSRVFRYVAKPNRKAGSRMLEPGA